MYIFLLIVGIACLLTGLAGAILPLPGPALSFVGLLFLNSSQYATFSFSGLVTFGIITLVIGVLDYYIPIWGIKKFGGTRQGAIGAVVGGVAGIFVIPAVGIFLGTFLGALAGELLGGATSKNAIKSAIGSFIGFITGIFMQVALCIAMIIYAGVGFYDQI